ncbi:MAG: LpqB family beta-propeller domain-containing protein [Cellulomonas sp.]
MSTTRRPVGRTSLAGLPLLALVVALLLGACAAIPTSGAVGLGVTKVTEPGPLSPLGERPDPGAGPVAIVQGFLRASAAGFSRDPSADVNNDFSVAREYLAGEARGTWRPREHVVVYPTSSIPEITLVSDTQVQVKLSVAARIDANGQYAEAAPGAQESLVFDLVEDSSKQWRISVLDDGVVLSAPSFEQVYRSAAIYFLSPDNTYLVPDVRWFPVRNLATSVVQALLAGPSEWLRDGVRTAVPDGVALTPDAVPIAADGTAAVGLSGAALADAAQRALLLAQIEATLRIPRVSGVQVTAGGVPLTTTPAVLQRGVDAEAPLEALQGDVLATMSKGALVPVDGVGSLAGLSAHDAARDEAGTLRVLLSGSGSLVLAPTPDGTAKVLLAAPGLVAPSVDRLGWAWTAHAGAGGSLDAVRADGQLVAVNADWLAGRTVRALRVSRDGTRIAVLSSGADGLTLDVAAVMRDDKGRPQHLGVALGVGSTLVDATRVVWVDDVTLGVLGRSGASTAAAYHLVPLAGQTVALPTLDDAVSIAGGKGERALYAATSDGQLFWRSGQSWVVAATGARDPYLPG